MPPKRAPKKGGQKSPPKSAFNSPGKFGSPIKVGKKDNRNVLDFEGVDKGVMNAYVKKHNAEEEAFMSYDMRLLNDNPGIMEELGINAILSRKGVDGETAMKQSATSTYNWRQFVFIIGEDDNTPANRKALASKLVAHFNSNANSANYQYPRKIKLGEDLTQSPCRPVDSILLDTDVLGMMLAAYPDTPLEELATFDEIMGGFWTDIEHGREVALGHAGANARDVGDDGEEEEEAVLADSDSDSD